MSNIFNNVKIDESATIHPQKFEKTYNYNSTEMLTLTIENFQVLLTNKQAEKNINNSISYQTQKFLDYVNYEMFKNAIVDYQNSQQQGFPFNPYGAFLKYTISYNQNCVLSSYHDQYTYTGGAHGSTLRFGTTYSLKTGRVLPLSYWFKNNYKQRVLEEVTKQADLMNAQQPGLLFEDYRKLLVDTFNEDSYYLSPEGLVFYYGQYDIAPYVAGIITFTIPYSQLDITPSC
jgi:hypothetical protein